MYEITIPTYTIMLGNLSSMLSKAAEHARANRYEVETLLEARLFPDMFSLKRQVQEATEHALRLALIAGTEVPRWPREEETVEELIERIDRTIDFIGALPAESMNGKEHEQVDMDVAARHLKLTWLQYQQRFNQANFQFHVITAYNILRHCGIPIGKRDFLGV